MMISQNPFFARLCLRLSSREKAFSLAFFEEQRVIPRQKRLEFSILLCYNKHNWMQGSYIGNTTASQAVKAGSTPVPCSNKKRTFVYWQRCVFWMMFAYGKWWRLRLMMFAMRMMRVLRHIGANIASLRHEVAQHYICEANASYPAEVRRIIYTTNIIEGLNRQFRKISKNKPSFTNDDSLRKLLYLASKNIVEHWTAVCRNWDMVSNYLTIMFYDRQAL